MRTTEDIIGEVMVRLGTNTTVSSMRYTDEILNDWLRLAHRSAASYKKWPFTEGRVSTTYASLVTDEDGLLAGEYPEGWRPDSIRMLKIGGKTLEKRNYTKFCKFLEDNPNSDEKIFTDYGRRYYVSGDVSGTIAMWGQFSPTIDPTDRDSLTVFSDRVDEGNEAVVNLMLSYAMVREQRSQDSLAYLQKAQAILEAVWVQIKDEQYAYHSTDDEGMFKRLDVLGGAMRDDTFKRDQWH